MRKDSRTETSARVAVTGLGMVSSIGATIPAVLESLQTGRSGIVFLPRMKELGFRCNVYGPVKGLERDRLPRKLRQTAGEVGQLAAAAAFEAIADAGLAFEELRSELTGVIVSTGLGGISEATRAEQLLEATRPLTRAGGVAPVRIMNSTASGNLAAALGVQGRCSSLSSACSTGGDSIGHAYELIRHGVLEVCICGSAEEDSWEAIGASFDNSQEMPRNWNLRPQQACRPYDRDREGFVLGSGAGVLILESLARAKKRSARIYAELIGYGSSNDGNDLFRPSGEGLKRAILQAAGPHRDLGPEDIDYINTHGTGTQIGDRVEVQVIKSLFADSPLVGSTKGLTGHALGATASMEAVMTLLMLHHNFVAATANLETIARDCEGVRHIQKTRPEPLKTAMTFNSGLGGSNACLVFAKP